MNQISEFSGLSQIGQISVVVHDVDRATAFYRDVLGMKLLLHIPDAAFFDCGGIRLMVGLASQPEFDHPSSVIYFRVEDIQQSYQAMTSRGVTFEDKPHLVAKLPDHELWMTFFRDADNNLLALMSEIRA